MHEISLIRNIFRTLEDQCSPEELDSLKTVYLTLGKLSNVEPTLMQSALDAVKQDSGKYLDVHLEIEVTPIKIYCELCDKESFIEHYSFRCAHCGQPNNHIVSGEEMLISKVEFFEQIS